jgi:hypothetical protein
MIRDTGDLGFLLFLGVMLSLVVGIAIFGGRTPENQADGVLLRDVVTGECVYLHGGAHIVILLKTPCPEGER